jgi:hypothetical protein
MLERLLAVDTLRIDVGSVQASEITKPKPIGSLFNDAMFFGNDPIQKLDGVVRVAPDGVGEAKFERPPALRSHEDETRHQRGSLPPASFSNNDHQHVARIPATLTQEYTVFHLPCP